MTFMIECQVNVSDDLDISLMYTLLQEFLFCYRYHFFLQLKKDILEGKLVVPYKSAALLASYAVQCKSAVQCVPSQKVLLKSLSSSVSPPIRILLCTVTHRCDIYTILLFRV